MSYTPQAWADNDPTKPVSAARMTHIEDALVALDTAAGLAAAARGVAMTHGDGTALTYVLTHNLNTYNLHVSVINAAAPREDHEPRVERTSVNAVTVYYLQAPALNTRTALITKAL